MINYKFKSECLSNPLFKSYRKYRLVIFKYIYYEKGSRDEYDNACSNLYDLENAYPLECREFNRLLNARVQRVKRLRERVKKMLFNEDGESCIFITFNFSPQFMVSHNEQSRRDLVRRYLDSLECPFIANKDYGAKNHREHYHGIIQRSNIDLEEPRKIFGRVNVERINISELDVERVSKYVAKLTNHAIKETTKQSRIIYSRKYK